MSIQKRVYTKKNGKVTVSYKAVVTQANGKQVSKSFPRKVDADRWEADMKLKLGSGEFVVTSTKYPFRPYSGYWIESYAERHKSPSSVVRDKGYLKKQLLPEFGDVPLNKIKPKHVERWLSELQKDLSPKTCNGALGLLKKMLNDAVRWEFISVNPIQHVKRLRLPERDLEFLTRVQVNLFLSLIWEAESVLYPLFATAVFTGLRRGEMKGLKWDCIDFDTGLLTVKRSFCFKSGKLKDETKSKRIRRVPMNQTLIRILREHRLKTEGEFVFPGIDFGHVHRTMKRLTKKAEVPPVTFHGLRHTFASNFMMSGGSIYDLQKMLGHSTIQMTERYSHLSPDHLSGKTEILDFGDSHGRSKVVEFRQNKS